jgi:hypothetical protein
VRAGGIAPGDGATDVIGDDAGDRRRVLAGLAVVVAVAALLVTFTLNRPTGGPRATAEAARGGPGGGVVGTAGATDPAVAPSGAPTPTGAGVPAVDGTPGGPTGGPGNGPGRGGAGGGVAGGPGGNNGTGNSGNGNGGTGNGGTGNGGPGGPGGGGTTSAAGKPVRLGTLGGVIVAGCAGNQVNVTGAEPAAGATLVSLQSGPRDKARVEFSLAGVRLRFEVRCVGGVPVAAPD